MPREKWDSASVDAKRGLRFKDEDTEGYDNDEFEDAEPDVENFDLDDDANRDLVDDDDLIDIPDDKETEEIPLDAPVVDIEETIIEEIEKNNEEVLKHINSGAISDAEKEFLIEELAAKNIKTVYYVANKFSTYTVTQEDLISAGMLGYAKALKKFNPDRGVKFSTFAINCIKNEIRFCLRKENRYWKNHISMNTVKYEDKNGSQVTLEDVIPDKNLTPEEEFQKNGLRKIILQIINTLSPIEKYIITYRFGLDREIELTQKEIAEQVDMSQANVSKIERGCMDKIKELYISSLSK